MLLAFRHFLLLCRGVFDRSSLPELGKRLLDACRLIRMIRMIRMILL